MFKYYKLFDLLNRREMKKTDLLEIISSKSLAKLSKGDNIQTEVLNTICEYLNCQPGDIMEYVPDPVKKKGTLEKLSEYYKAGVNYTMSKTDEEVAQAKSKPIKALKETAKEGVPIVEEINRKQKAEDRYIDSLKDK